MCSSDLMPPACAGASPRMRRGLRPQPLPALQKIQPFRHLDPLKVRQTPRGDRTNEQAIAVARGQAELPPFIAKGKTRWQEIRHAYEQAATSLDATGRAEDQTLAGDVRGFLDKHLNLNATPEIFAVRHARNLELARQKPEQPAPEPSPRDRGRRR